MITEKQKIENYQKFERFLNKIVGENSYGSIIEELGGKDKVMNASYATKKDTGLAYEGSLIDTVLKLAVKAKEINDLLPEELRVDARSIYKVCLLSHLSKVVMFKPNTNTWAVEKLGTVYDFETLPGALRFGERSILIATNAGVTFTPEEFEAMRYLGLREDDEMKYYSSSLSVVIKQAYELVNLIAKNTLV